MHSGTLKVSGIVSASKTVTARLRDVPEWTWLLAVLAYVGVLTWSLGGVGVYGFFGDPDDATRLIQVRELMTSGHWFDTTTMKIGGDSGMLSHWSRLVDLPIAALIEIFHIFMPIEAAERLVHIVWPLSLLGGLVWVMFKATTEAAGDAAGRLILLFAAFTPLAWYQFAIGRIDHHNVMIAATISATMLIWAYPERADFWRIAGVLTGLALAVGYEALAPAVALGTFVAVWGVFDRRAEKGAAAFALALALTFAAAFFATIPPSRWMDIKCDAISLNMVALVGCGVGGLLVTLGPGRDWTMQSRIASMAVGAAAGIAIFGLVEPKCLAGPMGQLPPLAIKIWLDKVAENRSIVVDIFRRNFEQSLGLLLFYGLGLALQVRQLRETRAASDLFLLAMLATLVGLSCWQYKYVSYASFLSFVPAAVAFSRLGSIGEISAATVKLGAIVLLNQTAFLSMSSGLNALVGVPSQITEAMNKDSDACMKRDSVLDLADLTSGLMAANIDVGAFIAANTHHRALAAPYHRIADAIIANHEIFSAHDDKTAAALLKQENVDYVVICDGLDKSSLKNPEWKGTLKVGLVGGKAPGYLVAQTLSNPHSVYHVWKVDRAALNLQLSKAAASAP